MRSEPRTARFLVAALVVGLSCESTALAAEPAASLVQILSTPEKNGGFGFELHRIRVSGKAVDRSGNPVAGARIFLATTTDRYPSAFERLRGETVTGADGTFQFAGVEVLLLRSTADPIPTTPEAVFMVFGAKEDAGFTWHANCRFRPDENSEDDVRDAKPVPEFTFGPDEPIELKLTFDSPATFEGVVLDDSGQPLRDAKVQVGLCDNIRRPRSIGNRSCRAMGGDSFDAIEFLPAEFRETKTNEVGEFRLPRLRPLTEYLAQIDPGPEFESYQFKLVTSEGKSTPARFYSGGKQKYSRKFTAPRRVVLTTRSAQSNSLLEGVTVTAHGENIRRQGMRGASDESGVAELRLPPGEYQLHVEPPVDRPFLFQTMTIQVDDEPTRELQIAVPSAAEIVVRALSVDDKKPIAGVAFTCKSDESQEPQRFSSQTVIRDYPVTNDAGKLRAFVPPGRRRFMAAEFPEGWEAVEAATEYLELEPGKKHEIEFEFRESELVDKRPPPDLGLPKELVGRWTEQERLLRSARGRARVRAHRQTSDLPIGILRELLDSLDPSETPDLEALYANRFNKPLPMGEIELWVDGIRRKSVISHFHSAYNQRFALVTLFNGNDAVTYDEINAQADVFSKQGFRLKVMHLRDCCYVPPVSMMRPLNGANKPKIEAKDDTITATFGLQARATQITASQATGFVYRQNNSMDELSGKAIWQFGPKVSATGLVVPSLYVEANYRKGLVHSLAVYEIEEVDFTTELPLDTFAVSLPAGVLAIDHRNAVAGRPSRPKMGVLRAPVTDLVAHVYRRSDRTPTASKLKYGDAAPAIEVASWLAPNGKKGDSPDLKGKILIVEFWGIWCGPCVAQIDEVKAAADYFRDNEVVVIGLHSAEIPVEHVRELANKHKINYWIGIDRSQKSSAWSGATFDAFEVRSVPQTAVIDAKGRLVYMGPLKTAIQKADALAKQAQP